MDKILTIFVSWPHRSSSKRNIDTLSSIFHKNDISIKRLPLYWIMVLSFGIILAFYISITHQKILISTFLDIPEKNTTIFVAYKSQIFKILVF